MMTAARQCSSWSDLQPELLGLVLRRLPSLADRVRLRAVCHTWRRHARLEPGLPSPLPWLALLDGTFLSIPGGEIHRVTVPGDARRCHGSMGNWLFLEHFGGGCSLMNPFSKAAAVQLPNVRAIFCRKKMNARPRYPIYLKLVPLSSELDPSPHSLFAVLITDNKYGGKISICQPPIASTFRVPEHRHIHDVAFSDGKLYALSEEKLFVLEIDSDYKGAPRIPPNELLDPGISYDQVRKKPQFLEIVDSIRDPGTTFQSFANKGYDSVYWGYLAESSGRLLLVRRLVGVLSTVPKKDRMEHVRTLSFDLYEADLSSDSCGQWKRVNSLGGQALFVGTHSKSLPASECGAQEDCIYFMRDYDRGNVGADPLCDCGVFNVRNGKITPLLPETAVVRPQGEGRPAWFFPTETMQSTT